MPKPPPALVEVRFTGENIYPERIPLRKLADALSAVQQLAAHEEQREEETVLVEAESLNLMAVERGSAVFQLTSTVDGGILDNLRRAGRWMHNPEAVSEHDFLLRPVEKLSEIARILQCQIEIREAQKKSVLAEVGAGLYETIAKALLIQGQTSFIGEIKRVGGATALRCGLRVPFQHKLLYCGVRSREVARRIGQLLYEEVMVAGTAQWIKNSWRVFSFEISDVTLLKRRTLDESIEALRRAGGNAWEAVDDPAAYLREVTGE